jgi:hypothetical protein
MSAAVFASFGGRRHADLDFLRGVAVLVMVLDHFLLVRWPASDARELTRVAMPLFMLVSGHLARWSGRSVLEWACRQAWRVLPFLLVSTVAGVLVPNFPLPDVLWSYILALPLCVVFFTRSFGVMPWLVLLATWAAVPWPLGGYSPLVVFGWLAVGYSLPALGFCVGPLAWDVFSEMVAGVRLLRVVAWCGRWSLEIYSGQLLALAVVFLSCRMVP